MTTEAYLGSNLASVLDKLTPVIATAVGFALEQRAGAIEDARVGAPPRVTWVEKDPGGVRHENAPFAMPGMDLQWLECIDYDVHAWARSPAELSAILQALHSQLDIYFGPPTGSAPIDADTPARPGYAMGKASSKGPKVAPEDAGSAYAVVPVTLKTFVPRRVYGSAPINSVPVEIDLATSTGSEQAIPVPL